MPIKTYSPEDVALTIGGNVITGFADGEFIMLEREVDAMTKVVGADGEVTRVRSANRSGSCTITLKQDSDANRILGGYAADDERDGSGIFTFGLVDNLENKEFAAEAWVRKLPNRTYGTELGNREWVIDLAKMRPDWPAA